MGCYSARGVVNMAGDTPESQSKGVGSSQPLPIGLGLDYPSSSGVWGEMAGGVPPLGLYLQGLKEVQGIRIAARDEAEGGTG